MPRFCANISMLFTESAFPDRFDAAARAGFKGVEFHYPYAYDAALLAERAQQAGVEVVLFNLPPGDVDKGDRGMACLPARVSEFRDGVGQAIAYARALGCKRLNMLSGVVPEPSKGGRRLASERLRETYISNLRFAAGELGRAGIMLHLEPINTRAMPGMYLRHSSQAIALMDEAGVDNARLQYDLFHMQIMEGDLAHTIGSLLPRIGHMQIADVPGRHEPGTGELNFPFLFAHIDSLGYRGWIGAEYKPSGRTADSFAWLAPYLEQPHGPEAAA